MGICVHCMSPKPITANKCPYCHERTGLLASFLWSVSHKLIQWIVIIITVSLVYQCTVALGTP